MSDTVYVYGPDQARPQCPTCGAPVEQTTDTPEIEWEGVCIEGHRHTFELDDEEE